MGFQPMTKPECLQSPPVRRLTSPHALLAYPHPPRHHRRPNHTSRPRKRQAPRPRHEHAHHPKDPPPQPPLAPQTHQEQRHPRAHLHPFSPHAGRHRPRKPPRLLDPPNRPKLPHSPSSITGNLTILSPRIEVTPRPRPPLSHGLKVCLQSAIGNRQLEIRNPHPTIPRAISSPSSRVPTRPSSCAS
jgi:hypothetical protein